MPPAHHLAAWANAAETLPAVARALAVDLSGPAAGGCAFLFVVLHPGRKLDDSLWPELHHRATAACGTAPDAIYAAPDLPRATDGSLLPLALRRTMTGELTTRVVAEERVANPASLEWFVFLFNNL